MLATWRTAPEVTYFAIRPKDEVGGRPSLGRGTSK